MREYKNCDHINFMSPICEEMLLTFVLGCHKQMKMANLIPRYIGNLFTNIGNVKSIIMIVTEKNVKNIFFLQENLQSSEMH